MAKLTVKVPELPRPADLTSPQAIKKIWAEAIRDSAKEVAELRARRARSLHA
jgi:hypothetical protein